MVDLVAPDNDYRALASSPAGEALDVSVVIPIYNRVALLDNVLAGLSVQDFGGSFEVIVVDDGSEEDVRGVCDRWTDSLDIRYVRQSREGRGAGRARNVGASQARNDLLVFVDADCVPSRNFLTGHEMWHRGADNIVVSASRRHIDREIGAGEVASAWADLLKDSGLDARESEIAEAPDDWRRVFYRRSQRLLLGDEAYRAVLGGLMSVRAARFGEVGGFDESFRTWGGEDTELGWRLWNSGCFIVPDDDIVVLHQRHLDLEGGVEGRMHSRHRILSVMADKVPQRFYRKAPSHLYSVPKVSWIVSVENDSEKARALRTASEATFRDSELIVIATDDGGGDKGSETDGRGRINVVPTLRDALSVSRGEIVALADGRARFDHRLLARAVRRFEDPRTGVVRVGYKASPGRLLRIADLDDVDSSSGRGGLPFFALIRRRELMKDRSALDSGGSAWTAAAARSNTDLLVTDLVEVPAESIEDVAMGTIGLREMRAAGAAELARGIKRVTTPAKQREEPAKEQSSIELPGIEYVGLAGHRNLGDDAMLEAVRQLMPWAEVGVGVKRPRAVMLGGGTLFNAGGYYRNRVNRVDGPNLERVVFGTGVRGFDYWGRTEDIDDWAPFLRSSLSVGVRGPGSESSLRSWGYNGPVEIIGDAALSLQRPEAVHSVDGRVVVCPVFTNGESWGGDDRVVFDGFVGTIQRLLSEGREVVMMTAHPNDDRWAIEIMRKAGQSDMPYMAGYDSLPESLELIASSELVIGERLHAIVLAAAVGTPFVGVEYRPKLRDFARSVGREDALVRSDAVDNLDRVVDSVLTQAEQHAEETAEAVALYRNRQIAVAEILKAHLTERAG